MIFFYNRALRFFAILKKEWIEIRREYITYIFLILIPFMQVILFGYIIQTDAKHLPTVVIAQDNSNFTSSVIASFVNTGYFDVIKITQNPATAEQMMSTGKVQFIINIPENFTHDVIRGKKPHILLEGDATDPVAISNAFDAAKILAASALNREIHGSLNYLKNQDNNFVVDTHAKYNPAIVAQYHTLPGLIVSILTLSLILLTAISITTEFERGTMETLLITPIKPIEVILGKILPHVIMGYILLLLSLVLSYFLFRVPFHGSLFLLLIVSFPFIVANLGIGLAASTVSKTQLRAANIANTYTLPAIFLSGFMFPFHAMPVWAQWIGNLLPPTHYLRMINGIMLKGATFTEIWPDLWPIIVFMIIIIWISFKNYHLTLD